MHTRPVSPSTIPGTESEARDEPVARKRVFRLDSPYALASDEDDVISFVKPLKCALTSNKHEQLSTSDQAALQHVVDSLAKLAKLSPQNVPHQPPHSQHIPSPFEIAQTHALIADQEVQAAELDAKLGELARDMLFLTRQRDTAAQAARNYRSFIAGKCLS
jgi:hypothetical protein